MTEQFPETHTPSFQRQTVRASEYSAHIQEAMRSDRLDSSDYSLVMTILHAVFQGYTEKRWQEEQHNLLEALLQQRSKERTAHADGAHWYEQTVSRLKDLSLWPW